MKDVFKVSSVKANRAKTSRVKIKEVKTGGFNVTGACPLELLINKEA